MDKQDRETIGLGPGGTILTTRDDENIIEAWSYPGKRLVARWTTEPFRGEVSRVCDGKGLVIVGTEGEWHVLRLR